MLSLFVFNGMLKTSRLEYCVGWVYTEPDYKILFCTIRPILFTYTHIYYSLMFKYIGGGENSRPFFSARHRLARVKSLLQSKKRLK